MKQTLYNRRLLDVIEIISSGRESGQLKIQVRTTMGYVFFKDGKLVDAKMGALTGFPAINAAASIREADFSFDPSVQTPASSFISPNERMVLKQLFGIETVDPQTADNEVNASVGELPTKTIEAQPTEDENHRIIEEERHKPIEEDSHGLIEDDSEVTLVTAKRAIPKGLDNSSYRLPPPSQTSYRRGLYVAILLVLMAAASVTLLLKSDNERSPMSAANSSPSSLPPITGADKQGERKDSAPNNPSESSSLPTVTDANKQVEEKTSVQQSRSELASQPLPTDAAKQIEQQSSAVAQNLTGRWNVVNLVEKTSYQPFNDLKIAFRLRIKQAGSNFTAEGEKVSENGRMLTVANRTPIRLNGSINGDRVEATFIEKGTRRKTSGRFVWRIDKAGGLRGTFDSTAAKTSGKSAATKEL